MIPSDENETALRKLVDTFVAGWNIADGEKLASVFTQDADFTAITGLRARGRHLIARGHNEILPLFTAEPQVLELSRAFTICARMSRYSTLSSPCALRTAILHSEFRTLPPGSSPRKRTVLGGLPSSETWFRLPEKCRVRWNNNSLAHPEHEALTSRSRKREENTGIEMMAHHEITTLLESMFRAWNRGDLEAYTNFWREDADLVNVLGKHLHGRAAILAELRTLHAFRFKGTRISNLEHTTKLLSPDIAVVRVNWEMQETNLAPGEDPSGRTRHGIFTHIAQRMKNGWQLIASQNTEIVSIPEFQQKSATLVTQPA